LHNILGILIRALEPTMVFKHSLYPNKMFEIQNLGDIPMEPANEAGVNMVAMPKLHKLNGGKFSFRGISYVKTNYRSIVDDNNLVVLSPPICFENCEKSAYTLGSFRVPVHRGGVSKTVFVVN
jgi:hypothetical protein